MSWWSLGYAGFTVVISGEPIVWPGPLRTERGGCLFPGLERGMCVPLCIPRSLNGGVSVASFTVP